MTNGAEYWICPEALTYVVELTLTPLVPDGPGGPRGPTGPTPPGVPLTP